MLIMSRQHTYLSGALVAEREAQASRLFQTAEEEAATFLARPSFSFDRPELSALVFFHCELLVPTDRILR